MKTALQLAEQIVASISGQKLSPGNKLPNERSMCEAYGCGRGTLREALRFLELQGVISIRSGPGGGPIVRSPSVAAVTSSMSLLLHLRGVSFGKVIETRLLLEPILAEQATAKISQQQLDALGRTVSEMTSGKGNDADFLDQNQLFHQIIANAADNVIFASFIESLNWITDGSAMGISYGERERQAIARAHSSILVELAGRNAVAAAERMRVHILEFARYVEVRYPESIRRTVTWTGAPHPS